MNIEFDNTSGVACDQAALTSLAEFALLAMGIHEESELSISVVNVEEMSKLHVQWMDLAGPTDVLSFPMDELTPNSAAEGPGMVGDIVLCPEFAAKNEAQQPLEGELALLTVHGVLHCLGFDHAEPAEEKAMFALQEKILADWKAQR